MTPIEYTITTKVIGSWWHWNRTEYYVESRFLRLGPFTNRADAEALKTGLESV